MFFDGRTGNLVPVAPMCRSVAVFGGGSVTPPRQDSLFIDLKQ
ncbi:MAG: hypothetical protein QHD01_34900 [Bradyrhizobium sp.]|nr:hypothetical protein [Bradyrhizobium sp.]MDX3971761.1 hypothetical protein [Bradyrhizobium sp.]